MNIIGNLKDLLHFRHSRRPAVPFLVLFKKFKSILERNYRILELMADMGDKLGGDYVFDRQYISEVCERVSDLVFKLISDLCILTRSDNVELFIAFERIQHQIQEELAGRRAFAAVKPAVLLDDLTSDLDEEAGNKFAGLGDIRNVLGLTTPDGFVITAKAFCDFMDYNGLFSYIDQAVARGCLEDEAVFETMCRDVNRRILEASIPRHIQSNLNAMLDILSTRNQGQSLWFAVRSSAWAEDGEHSFAGQYESMLNVPASGIPDAYRRVIASAYAPGAWQYRLHRGFREHETAMAVGCQLMAGAEVSGAINTYATLPLEKESLVISAAWGMGPAVVQGIAESDTYVLDRLPPYEVLSREIGHKAQMIVPSPGSGTGWSDVPEPLRDAACLSKDRMERLARAAMIIERYYKRPQNVEWAFDRQDSLYILQSRPLNIRPANPEAHACIDNEACSEQLIFSDKGIVVQGGVASGKVYVAQDGDDLKDFPYGAILVTRYTSPKYARIMRKAHGIITDVGSASGHMATLAREHRVPTVVATASATRMLNAGDEITLDASRNAVYRGTVKALSHFELTEQDIFEESYEYRLLRRLIKKINPLNLVDPHGEDFKAGRCRTYHDITRYVHEKAVEKVIHLSENYHQYHDKTPMRLQADLPLGLMIIDIEGGTRAAQNAGSVTVDQILSVPLKALLQGLQESGM